jgi:hypothetical protein
LINFWWGVITTRSLHVVSTYALSKTVCDRLGLFDITGLRYRDQSTQQLHISLLTTAGTNGHTLLRRRMPTKPPLDSRHDPQGLISSHQSASFQTNEPLFPLTTHEVCVRARMLQTPSTANCYFPAPICCIPASTRSDRHSDATQWPRAFVPAAVFRRVMVARREK